MWGGGCFLYYSYVCIVKTMSFENAGGRRERRARKNLLTVKLLKDPILGISISMNWFMREPIRVNSLTTINMRNYFRKGNISEDFT